MHRFETIICAVYAVEPVSRESLTQLRYKNRCIAITQDHDYILLNCEKTLHIHLTGCLTKTCQYQFYRNGNKVEFNALQQVIKHDAGIARSHFNNN